MTRLRPLGLLLSLAVASAGAQAQFLGNAFFSMAPQSQLGPVTNNLVITNFSTHFTVSGQVLITVPAGAVAGTLVEWEILRPLDPTFPGTTLYTGTQMIGFSTPPAGGSYGNTSGAAQTRATNFAAASLSTVPLNLGNGVGNWGVIIGSLPFVYTASAGSFVQQRLHLDGVQLSGAGGTWVVDVPLTSFLQASPVPEPASAGLFAAGAAMLLAWRAQSARRAWRQASSTGA